MFCQKCGFNMKEGAAFCPSCGEKNTLFTAVPQNSSYSDGAVSAEAVANVRKYLVRGVVAVVAVILSVIAIIVFAHLVNDIESVIALFSKFDGLVTGVGIAGYIICALLLGGCAVLAALPLGRFTVEGNNVGITAIDRGMAFSVALLVLCVAMWICKLIFHSSTGSNVSVVLYTIFSTYGNDAAGFLIPIIIALVLIYIVRTKLLPAAHASN